MARIWTRRSTGISTSLVQLLELGAPGEWNDAAMAVFLRLGFFLGEDTPVVHIRAMPPNGRQAEAAT